MSAAERAELDLLRSEKLRWEASREEDRAERARIMQEVNELRSQVPPFLLQNRILADFPFSLERRNGRKSHSRSASNESQRNTTRSIP